MNSSIANFVNKTFYGGQPASAECAKHRPARLIFIITRSKLCRKRRSIEDHSACHCPKHHMWCIETEDKSAPDYAQAILGRSIGTNGATCNQVTVLSHYLPAQVTPQDPTIRSTCFRGGHLSEERIRIRGSGHCDTRQIGFGLCEEHADRYQELVTL